MSQGFHPVLAMFAGAAAGAVWGSISITMNRRMPKKRNTNRKQLTIRPMLCGGVMMLAAGLATEAFPAWSGSLLLIVAYLVRVSGALGFSLWVWSQQYWSAVESGSINNTMLIETALLDVICFGRILDGWKWCGMLLAFLAITLLQIQGKRRR